MPPDSIVFGRSEAMETVRDTLEKFALSPDPVLIHGENGTGKELIAKILHLRSANSEGIFLKVDCRAAGDSALDRALMAARKTTEGAESGNSGTLLLDEIGDLSPALQNRLLLILQQQKPGSGAAPGPESSGAWILAASSRDLSAEVDSGHFLPELRERLHAQTLRLPPLRERKQDIPALADYFIACFSERYSRVTPPISVPGMRLLQEYHWPGNIRELENLVKRYVIVGSEEAITDELLRREFFAFTPPSVHLDAKLPLKQASRQVIRELERHLILRSLQSNHWNRRRTARDLQISYRALLYKIRDGGIARLPRAA